MPIHFLKAKQSIKVGLDLTAGGLCLLASVAWGQGQFLAPPMVISPDRTQIVPSSTPSAAAIGQPPINVVGGSWIPQGPAPTENGQVSNISPNDQVIGAIQAVLAHPTNPNILYLGAVNGGVWRTLNATAASPTWTPLLDSLPTYSIGALEFDLADASAQTLIAGVGRTSSFGAVGGPQVGVPCLRTTDGGLTWTPLTATGNLIGEDVTSVAARGNILMAATDNAWSFFPTPGGLYRSANGGATFVLVSGGNGLPAGSVSDLVGDPANPARFYAAVVRSGIFRSDDTGATWVNVTTGITGISANTTKIEMSVHNSSGNNVVYVAVSNNGQNTAVFRSTNQGGAWTAMDTVNANIGGQAAVHFSIVADKTSPTIVYVGGDRIAASPFTGNLFRGNSSLASGSQWTPIVNGNADPDGAGPLPGTAPHADSREMVIDANGNIIEGDDGGIYRRSSPTLSTGVWTSVIGNLQVAEIHDLAYDRNAKVLISGTQDNGTHVQRTPGSLVWDLFGTGGDGGDVAVDDTSTPGFSIRYASSQYLQGFRRYTYDANNNFVSSVAPALALVGGGSQLVVGQSGNVQFVTPVVLNAHDKTRLIIGANSVYESLDKGDTVREIGAGVPVNGTFDREPVAYGGKLGGVTNLSVLYVGSGSRVFVRTNAGGALIATAASFPGGRPKDIVLDRDNWRTAYVVGDFRVYATQNAGAAWTDITGNLLTLGSGTPISLEFISTPTGNAVVVGTDVGVYISFVSSLGTWSVLGTGFPGAMVSELVYDPVDDVLFAGTFGRGAFKLNPGGGGGGGQQPSLNIADAAVTEPSGGTTNAVFSVTLSPAASQTVTVNFATADNTATAGADYVATNGALSFPAGTVTRTITVQVNSDALAEGNETFFVNLSNPTNATLGKAQGAGIILNGEPPLITGFAPTNGPIGTTVTITGANFSPLAPGNTVYFGAVRATVLTATTTNLTVPVPVGATFAPISVSVGGFTAFSAAPFNVTFLNNNLLNASSFAGHVELAAGANTRSVVAGDFNNDGKPDLAAANFNSGTVSVFRNVGSLGTLSAGSFAAKSDLPAGSGPFVVTSGDLDGDGRLDLVVVNYNSGTVSLFRNTSTGGAISFATKVDLVTGLNPRAVLIGDVDIDGLPDVVVANEGSSSVSVFRNLATGGITTNSFAAKVDFIVGTSPSALAFGDIDGDGKPDLVIANGFNGPGGNSISILRNTSTRGTVNSSTFATRVSFLTPAAPLSVAIGDLDLDGLPDIVTANSGNSSVSAFRNTTAAPGTITLATRVDFSSGSTTRTVAIGDMDGDGKPDLVVANETVSTVSVLQNSSITPTINFAAPVAFATAGNPFGVAVADLDRDFKPEMITANTSGSVSILRNQLKADPSVTWATPGAITYGTRLSSTQLNASAGVPGNFIYSPSIGTVLSAGANQVLSATFVPYESGTYNTRTVTTTITVNLVALTVTPDNAARSYGVTNPVFTGTLTGLQNNDNITAVFTSLATSATPVGEYGTTHPNAIFANLTDPNNRLANYTVASANGTLTITKAPLTVTVNNASRAYGAADPAFSVTFIGLANNDPIGATFIPAASQSDPPGIYVIDAVLLPTDALTNYAAPTVNPGALTVTPAALTITADNTNRTYGAANPAFTGTVNGLVGSDTATPTFGSAATPTNPVGAYAITVSSLSGSALANYAVTINTGTLAISKAPLTVTPADTNRVFGAANPAFTGTVAGLQNNDAITPNYASAAAPPSPPGNYDITATLSDPTSKLGNYAVTLNKGTLTVTGGDAPIITLSSNVLNYVENAGAVILNGGATVTDAGSPDFNTGVLAVNFTAGGVTEDRLAIRNQGTNAGQIGVSGANVNLGGASIGTFTGGTDGSSPLLITLNSRATPQATQVLLRNLTYENVSEDPATNARTVQIVLTDGDGGTSAPVTLTLNVATVNDAPTVTWLAPTNNAALKAPGPFTLQTTATDVDGAIQQVEFFAGTTSLGVATNAPYEVIWTNVAVGSYTLRAVATDRGVPPLKGTNSPPIDVSVNPGFNAAQVSTNGQFQLTLTGAQGIKYDVEISTDLISWVKIGQVTAGVGATPFLDAQQISFIAQRFYRFKVHTQ